MLPHILIAPVVPAESFAMTKMSLSSSRKGEILASAAFLTKMGMRALPAELERTSSPLAMIYFLISLAADVSSELCHCSMNVAPDMSLSGDLHSIQRY